ncbi:MAG: protein-methionine-sulfoxide reductase catalytic subunit MsrP [Chelatococcus sp.]|uniref:protein-methionine-sulfoxide reductase catalytic subunit MsrP n=1 Tax=unclassified Chelatococcus TaxID=2638111 RepID=UPI001BCE980B|nr:MULTISPECIES: protein-methionine-sulfoxide reductase catalytic subunit MsrP [unclassified Chelatococcus]CAH1665305.1 Protein-methionine-sulfoxide reductase catalytic subunit MsrP [Hyphomicrobiales bacterium]MBS7737700.1 protein-methionine-sulfoxide reductase catalytic subunit MsrP [Chelatococcus sp. HY11]MBX3536383.1 protein-methionine-sulfoxide reductase catalytic subunit MsrP [Chelatococcus sp.]MBX3544166.1 protein-methionine-sulfoxide reductase catalytic subunit MsrP [Chelatococcus sp.]M
MFVRAKRGWDIPEREAVEEAIFLNRRAFMAGGTAMALAAGGQALAADSPYPAARNDRYKLAQPVTPESDNTNYNNFYEFGFSKRVASAAEALPISPWTVKIDGLVEKPFEIAFEDLLRRVSLEERLYRHRCVEAWSMAVPWTGFPMRALVDMARPLGSAKYVVMKTFLNPKVAPAQKQTWYPWPYTEGLTIAEATNELTFMVTGAYGKPLPKVMGAPIRLATPWKYGFKSIKSIVAISFSETRPVSYWESLQNSEYGFWANVNPDVAHPRWSQAREEVLGTGEYRPTVIYNGYGEYVADMYKGMEGERLFM